MKTIVLNENLSLNIIRTGKFKDISFSFRFLSKISQRNATIAALVAQMASDRNEKAETKVEMTRLSDLFYGSYIDVRNTGYGEALCTEFKTKVIDGRYVGQSVLLEGFFEWFSDMIRYPLINDETLKEAKKNVESMLIRSMDNPMQFAVKKAFETAGKGYPLSVNIMGSLDTLNDIGIDECKDFLCDLHTHARLDIFVVGDIDETEIADMIRGSFLFKAKRNVTAMYQLENNTLDSIVWPKNMRQSNLVIIYNPQILPTDKDYWPYRVALTAFGQIPASLCFTEIREKRSLCYSIGAQAITFDGVAFVYAGIDALKAQDVENLIDIQLDAVKHGSFSDTLIDASKKMMINSIRQIEDDPGALINYYYQMLLIGRYKSKDEIIDDIMTVRTQDISDVFNKMSKTLRFLLKGDGNHEEDIESTV